MGVSTYWDVYSRVSKVFDPEYSVLRSQTYFFQNCLKPLEFNPIELTVFHPLFRHIVMPATLGGMPFKKKLKKIIEKTVKKIANFPWYQGDCIQVGHAKKWDSKVLEVQYLWHSLKYQPRRRQSWNEPKREKYPWIDGGSLLQNHQ